MTKSNYERLIYRRLVSEHRQDVVERASDAFWGVVAAAHPHIKTGDLPPDATIAIKHAMHVAVAAWLDANESPHDEA